MEFFELCEKIEIPCEILKRVRKAREELFCNPSSELEQALAELMNREKAEEAYTKLEKMLSEGKNIGAAEGILLI